MGYYSQVGLCLKRKDMDELKSRLEKLGKDRNEYYSFMDYADVDRVFDEGTEDEAVLMVWDSLKWYPSYPEVACVEDFLDEINSRDVDDDFSFVRIGEEVDDIETRANYNTGCCDHIYVDRTIGFDG